MFGKEYLLVKQKVDIESLFLSPIKKRQKASQLAANDLDTIDIKEVDKQIAEYAKKEMIYYDKMK